MGPKPFLISLFFGGIFILGTVLLAQPSEPERALVAFEEAICQSVFHKSLADIEHSINIQIVRQDVENDVLMLSGKAKNETNGSDAYLVLGSLVDGVVSECEAYTFLDPSGFAARGLSYDLRQFAKQSDAIAALQSVIEDSKSASIDLTELLAEPRAILHKTCQTEGGIIRVFARPPFAKGSIADRAGLNGSPNNPPFVSVIELESDLKIAGATPLCPFDRDKYVKQAKAFLDKKDK